MRIRKVLLSPNQKPQIGQVAQPPQSPRQQGFVYPFHE